MAFPTSTSDRMDELRFRNQQTSRNESPLLGLVSPPRNGARLPPTTQSNDGRVNLTRRFTTDSGRIPTINSLMALRAGQETQEYGPSVSSFNCPKHTFIIADYCLANNNGLCVSVCSILDYCLFAIHYYALLLFATRQ